jgi:hypothetical protein
MEELASTRRPIQARPAKQSVQYHEEDDAETAAALEEKM